MIFAATGPMVVVIHLCTGNGTAEMATTYSETGCCNNYGPAPTEFEEPQPARAERPRSRPANAPRPRSIAQRRRREYRRKMGGLAC